MKPRVALLADHLEEGWTSMDHYTAMLDRELARAGQVEPHLFRPAFHRRLGRLPLLLGPRHGHTLDRYLNRYWDYPRVASRARAFDLFHIMDQTYAHVAARLPAERTLVTCHDLDFAEPPAGTRLGWLVRMTGQWTLPGVKRAARVLCDSEVVRREIERRGLVPADRLEVVPLGVEGEFTHAGHRTLPDAAEALLARADTGPLVLHVGAMVARKRLDLVLRTFALIRRAIPGAVLVRAGGALSPALGELAASLELERHIVSMPFLSRDALAALYRRADVFLLCSDSEGFGLPVLEAMASGLPVVSRDIPAVREVAGEAARLVPGGEPGELAAAVVQMLSDEGLRQSMRVRGLERAAMFRWADTAERTARIYLEVARSLEPPPKRT